MEIKKYSSYAQIELELEILKVERALNLKRIAFDVHKAKENFKTIDLLKEVIRNFKFTSGNISGTIFNVVIPILIKWILKRKRGN